MDLSVDATTHPSPEINDSDFTYTWNHTCGASANKLVVLVGVGEGSATVSATATYNGVAMTRVVEVDTVWSSAHAFELNNPATGSAFSVTVTFSGVGAPGVDQLAGVSRSYIGAHATSGTGFSAIGSTDNPSLTVTDSASGDEVIALMFSDVGPNSATTEGGTLVAEDEDIASDSDMNAQSYAPTGANQVVSWTSGNGSGDNWAAVAFAVKPAAAAGPAINRMYYARQVFFDV